MGTCVCLWGVCVCVSAWVYDSVIPPHLSPHLYPLHLQGGIKRNMRAVTTINMMCACVSVRARMCVRVQLIV